MLTEAPISKSGPFLHIDDVEGCPFLKEYLPGLGILSVSLIIIDILKL